jgi:hypothetical protein
MILCLDKRQAKPSGILWRLLVYLHEAVFSLSVLFVAGVFPSPVRRPGLSPRLRVISARYSFPPILAPALHLFAPMIK